jgi:hypothetical protein
MPSTYSPDLRIELIANGEQSGSWGNTTNTNLGTLIEDAIAGTATVTTPSANYALTAYNGVADESRCAAVVLNTSTGANFAVYVPPVTKLYVVKNNSAYVATVYCSTVLGNTTAAGTGVAIPAGKSVLLRSDSTNIIEQLNQVVGDFAVGGNAAIGGVLTATSPVFSGTPTAPTAAFGTNSTQIATTAFVQAALQAAYPVGSVYINAASVDNPASIFGFGTWVEFGAGRVMVGQDVGDPLFDALEETGGSKDAIVVSHTHTVQSSGEHNHSTTYGFQCDIDYFGNNVQAYAPAGAGVCGNTSYTVESTNSAHTHTINSAGSSGTNANVQPFIVVKMWKRTL